MIQGIDKFKEYFADFTENYVIIGGLATALLMDNYGFLARATKDVDMVVISKDNNDQFLKSLLQFIDIAGYKTKQRTNNQDKRNLFRFLDSDNKEYPEQLELFAVHNEDSVIYTDSHIIPIETPEFYNYLSAILLDSDYYSLLIENTINIEGLNIATAEVLIPLKIHAHLNLISSEHHYDNKHLKDVIKLSALLDDEETITLSGLPKEDFEKFIPLLNEVEPNRVKDILKSMGVNNLSKDDIVSILKKIYLSEL